MSTTVSIVIVSYKTRDLTRQCLQSVFDNTHLPFEVIVVDNASGDGSSEMIRDEFPAVNLITLDENVGFGRGCNIGAKQANGEYICLLNPDATVHDGTIDALHAFALRRPGAGIWGGRSLNQDGSLDPKSCWGTQSLWSTFCFATGLSTILASSTRFNPESLGTWQRDSEREVGVVTGYLLLISKNLWNRLDGFDERFFMYGEDVDLAVRAHKLGFRPAITPDAVTVHVGGAASSSSAAKMRIVMKGKATVVRKHWKIAAKPGVFLLVAGVGLRAAGSAALSRLRRRQVANQWVEAWATRADWSKGYAESPKSKLSTINS